MVGLRVFDIGALVVWLVWFFRQRDDEDDEGGGAALAGAVGPIAAAIPRAALPFPTPTVARAAPRPPRRPALGDPAGAPARHPQTRSAKSAHFQVCINPTRFVRV